MNDGFRVDPDTLDAHARSVRALAGRVQRASLSGRPLGLAAYGVIGQAFAVAIAQATQSGSTAVARVAAQAAAQADAVRAAAQAYRRQERDAAAGLGGPR